MLRLLSVISLVIWMAAWEIACQRKTVAIPAPPPPAPAEVQPPAVNSPPRRAPRPVPAASAPPPSQPAPPRLGAILTPEQQRQHNTVIDQSLSRAQASLAGVGKRPLTKDQEATVNQIRAFIEQAKTTRRTDLPGAESLAERAEVLARDLAARIR